MSRLYSRTEAGHKAWNAQDGRIPLESRRVLGLVERDTDPEDICARLGCSESAVVEILKELEHGRLVKSIGAGLSEREELDFTQPLNLEELRAAREKK
jgi:DNA-binding Lrp family transcriptional regulator